MVQSIEAEAILELLEQGNDYYRNHQDYDEALKKYQAAYVLSREHKEARYKAFSINNIGSVYASLGLRRSARQTYNHVLDLCNTLQENSDLDWVSGLKDTIEDNIRTLDNRAESEASNTLPRSDVFRSTEWGSGGTYEVEPP